MIRALIEASIHNRAVVFLLAALAATAGVWAWQATPVDAIPDLSDTQVIVYTEVPGQSPQVVDDQVTYPLSTTLLAVPGATDVRGYSFFGYSLVYVLFDDGTDLYWARSRVSESLEGLGARLPDGVVPTLGPDATGVGWVYQFALSDFTPRAVRLRRTLDADGDGAVSATELPHHTEPIYADAVLAALFPAETRTEDLRFLHQAFDRDGVAGIGPEELGAAANFRGIDLAQLRSVLDFYLTPELQALEGVSELAPVGGFVQQYQVEVDPERLRAYGVTLGQVRRAIQDANQDVGGRLLELAETEFMVRGRGYLRSVEDLETIPVAVPDAAHAPVLLRQVARVSLGPAPRRGLVDRNGEGEVVSGIVVMRSGANARRVIERVEQRLEELVPGLPAGVEIHESYDRSTLIDGAVSSLQTKLLEELLVVAGVALVFLLHLRSALVAVITVPIGVGLSFVAMNALGIEANLMSLGGIAIAIGVMVDASIVLVENVHKHRERDPGGDPVHSVLTACQEVGPALFFSLLIVTVSFLPVFTLEAQEGRLFAPLAWTKTFAMAASALLAVTLVPALLAVLVRGPTRPEANNPVARAAMAVYRPLLFGVLRFPRTSLVLALGVVLATAWPLSRLGSEFMPPLDEGDVLYMPTTPPGLSVSKARELLQQTDRRIAAHPQVREVLGKVGRAQTATDPAPLTMIETVIQLTPRESWPVGKTLDDVLDELDASVQIPGLTNSWTMPIRTRIDMLATGIKTPVGIKVLGDDLDELARVATELEAVIAQVPGTATVFSERVTGGNYVDVTVRREDAARYGLNVRDINDVVASAVGGARVTQTIEGLERFDVVVRFPRELRNDLDALRSVPVPTPMGHTVPLAQVADVAFTTGPPAIKSENARRTAWVYVDLTTTDVGGYVAMAQEAAKAVALPPGVSLEWSGQYTYLERARERLQRVVPTTLGLILVLLLLHFRRWFPSLLVLGSTLLFAPIGGIWLLWAWDFELSVAVGVGFIALAGLAAETGVVMLVYLEEAVGRAREAGALGDGVPAVMEGAVERLRPKLMTVMTTLLGLLPVVLGTGPGTEVMQRIAAPMLGGLVSSAVLTLLVLPAAYLLWVRRGE